MTSHPDERPLELPAVAIEQLKDAARGPLILASGRVVRDDFIVVPVPSRPD